MLTFWRKRDWLYRWVLASLAETGAAIPWLLVFYSSNGGSQWAQAVPGPWLLILTYMVAGLWEAGVKKAKDNPWRRILTMIPAVILAYVMAYAVMPDSFQDGLLQGNLAFAFVPVAAYLWFQGTKGAAEGIEYDRVFMRFMWQVISQIVAVTLLIMTSVVAGGSVNLLLYWSVLLLFGAGLLLLVVTRDRTLRQGQAKLGDAAHGAGSTLSRTVGGIIIGLVVVTFLSSQLMSTENLVDLLRTIGHILNIPLSWLLDVAFLLIHRLVILLSIVITAIIWLYRRAFPPAKQAPPPEDVQLGNPTDYLLQTSRRLDAAAPYIKAALIIALVAGVALLLYRLTARIESGDAEEEERVSLGFWASLLADVQGLFRRASAAAATAVTTLVAETLNPTDPRSIYRRLQAYGETLGRPRGLAETPNAYQGSLAAAEPEAAPAARLVTSVYNQARYGAAAPPAKEIEQAAEALAHLTDGGAD